MNKNRKSLYWISFVSNRLARVDREGRSALTSFLATLGICFGVMTLIVVLSVMNGFQSEFKDAIMEISSYHLRVQNISEDNEYDFIRYCENNSLVDVTIPFYEAESFIISDVGNQSVSFVRAVPENILELDSGFKNEMDMISGSFSLKSENFIVLGSRLAYNLGVRTGSKITLLALSGSTDTALLSKERVFIVTGVFHSGYEDINASYAFVNTVVAEKYFGKEAAKIYGVKLKKQNADSVVANLIKKEFKNTKVESWKEYNRSLFNVLQIEKNMLMLLVLLIFVVVGINMYNGMRRLVFERRSEIAILSALGGTAQKIKSVFFLRSFFTGLFGSLSGLMLGLLISVNIRSVFEFASNAMYYVSYFFACLVNPENAHLVQENPMYMLYASIPAKIFPSEIFLIVLFGLFAPILSSIVASRQVLTMTVAEVLHDE